MMSMLIILYNRTGNSRLSNLLDKSIPRENSFELRPSECLHSSPVCMIAQKDGPEKQSNGLHERQQKKMNSKVS